MPITDIPFRIGERYSREDVANAVAYPQEKRDGGDFMTGYFEHNEDFFIFANIGVAGRTGHDYQNRWVGRELLWFAKNGTNVGQPRILAMTGGDKRVFVFWRARDRAPFTFAGTADAAQVDDVTPVRVLWSFENVEATGEPLEGSGRLPTFRRGPAPTAGERSAVIEDGETSTYLMRLVGPVGVLRPTTPAGHEIVKVGMSSAPQRRLAELNNGYPPGATTRWALVTTRTYPLGEFAFSAEGRLLEWLRQQGCWIGGEYGVVSADQLLELERLLASDQDGA